MASQLRIGIFGGSFNPPHMGHIAICRYVIAHDYVDRLLVVPCFQHPYEKHLEPYDDRMMMCRLAMEGLPQVEISTIEAERGDVSYTVDTVRAVQAAYPDATPILIVGQDAADEMAQWREGAWLQEHVQILQVPRGPTSAIPNVSSTVIRARGVRDPLLSTLVKPIVASYIEDHALYGA
jgi:nicotinate-nucleotide adenylyltransferase